MRNRSVMAVAAACVCGLGLLAGCGQNDVIEEGYGYAGPTGPTSTLADAGGITGDGAASLTPMLAKIDPSASMVQTPGQGVGVFTQYDPTTTADPGGHWYVWWTCDTNTSGQACDFAINVSVSHGDITNAVAQSFQGTDALTGGTSGAVGSQPATGALSATTTTTTAVQGVHFDTEPGAVITLSAALGGDYSGSFLFFVQDGKVNGGYTGMLTDPLELQSSSP